MVSESRKAKSSTQSPDTSRTYAWFSALIADDTTLLEDLLTHGVPIDVLHPLRHTTALMEATRRGATAIVEWLLTRGAAPALFCGAPLATPLHCSLRRHHWGIAEKLIAAMETTAVVDAYGFTPLHLLCMEAPIEHPKANALLAAVIDKDCPLDALDHEGTTALHQCVINDALEFAEVLLEHGAKVDALIPDTWVSPLTIAALEKNVAMAHLLLRYGADLHLRTRDGSSPASLAPSLAKLSIV